MDQHFGNPRDTYERAYSTFQWNIPEFYNIGMDVCDRHSANPSRVAMVYVNDKKNETREIVFEELRQLSNRLANILCAIGLNRGDRVAVLLPPSVEAAIAHLATWKGGFVSVPLASVIGEEEIHYRLHASLSRVLVTDSTGWAKLGRLAGELPALRATFITDRCAAERQTELYTALSCSSGKFEPVRTQSEDPAVLVFTSGTEGTPKGVLHAHRSLLGCLPVFELAQDSRPSPGQVFWTPADWGWIGGLFPVLGAWHYGLSVLTWNTNCFDPQRALTLMAKHLVQSAFIPPTALKLMQLLAPSDMRIPMKCLLSGGERLDEGSLDWAEAIFGTPIQEVYGQTECNGVVACNRRLFQIRAGSMGRAIPGHDVRIVDQQGTEMPRGRSGILAVRQPDPGTFLGYWKDPIATARKFVGSFLVTGDIASQDEDGYFWYQGREDDIITTSGYRIDPVEIEACIMRHGSVAMVAVVGIPDPICTQTIKAWIVLNAGWSRSEQLARRLQHYVRAHLGAHQCPRQISFTDNLPLTSTGKVMRSELRNRG
ncbi:MAG: AMP-binding protein [Candidatus Acidiferrales bacterium]